MSPLPAFAKSLDCLSRLHCDFCPYVLKRPDAEPYASMIWPVLDEVNEDDTPGATGLESSYAPPPGRKCPFKRAFVDGQRDRMALLVDRVRQGVVSEEEALQYAERLGFPETMESST